eukprot:7080366-Pyramimonas_sp.AAC.1
MLCWPRLLLLFLLAVTLPSHLDPALVLLYVLRRPRPRPPRHPIPRPSPQALPLSRFIASARPTTIGRTVSIRGTRSCTPQQHRE